MSARLFWLLYALIVVFLCFGLPKLLRAQQPPQFVYCDQGVCAMSEANFDRLLELAKKAGKTCL